MARVLPAGESGREDRRLPVFPTLAPAIPRDSALPPQGLVVDRHGLPAWACRDCSNCRGGRQRFVS